MAPRPADVDLLAALVHRGHVTREEAERCLARLRGGVASLDELLVAEGWFAPEEVARLRRTRGGGLPEIPGYALEERIGVGGTSEVFRAKEKPAGRAVALKVLHPHLAENTPARNRFVREARLLLELEHENVVKGFRVARARVPTPRVAALAGAPTTQDLYFFAMELIPGPTALELLEKRGPLPEEDALFVVLQVARALEYLRGKGIVHRDVKPGNVLVAPGNRVKLIDLGFASRPDAPAGDVRRGSTSGTVSYLSPEQARGEDALDVRSDIYSLGVTLHHLVVGSLPFTGADDEEVMRKQVREALSSAALKGRRISPHVHYFIEKMMAKEREIRYQSPADLIADIEVQIAGRKSLDFETAKGDGGVRPAGDLLGPDSGSGRPGSPRARGTGPGRAS
ncbi:MAG TPA: serine/threonine-protein kinase [Planctomycetota bacterium]|nr:serine/threonine-protein kinase [Planctomycetota bacterium]